MKTRQFFLGMSLLAIAGLWTGCSNDVEVEATKGKAIEFRTQGGLPQLKTVGTTTDQVETFVVYGTDDVQSTGMNIFDGVTVARQLDDTYAYSPTRYFNRLAASANFVAFSPVTANITAPAVPDIMSEASFNYTVVVPDNTGNKTQEDLLIAGTEVNPITGTVNLDFQHALARIFVKATNTLNDPVIIKRLTLRNLKSTGTIEGTPAPAWTWAWNETSLTSPIDFPYQLAESGVVIEPLATDLLVTSMEQGMMVLPQKAVNTGNVEEFDAGDFALEVTYDLANLEDQTVQYLLIADYPFEMGQQYAITMTFTGTAILFDINVTPWGAIQDATPAL